MLAACGGTASAIDMRWIQTGESDTFVTISKVGLTLWQMDKTLTRPLWEYKVC